MTDKTADNLLDASDDDLKSMGLPPAFTLDDLVGLTKAEIDALAEGDDPLVRLSSDDDTPSDDEDNDEDSDEDSDEDDQDDTPDDDADEPAEPVEEAAQPEAPSATPDPVIDLKDTTDAQKVVDGYDEALTALQDQFQDGDLTSDEFREKSRDLNKAYAKAERDLDAAAAHNTAQQTAYADAWYGKTAAFMDANAALADQKPVAALGGHSAIQVFDQSLRFVTGDARYSALTMDQKIAEAARIADAYAVQQTGKPLRREGAAAAAAQAPKAKATAQEPAPQTPKEAVAAQGKRPAPVQTLAGATAATETEIEDGRFAAIDNADGVDAEAAFARMSPAEQRAYLHGA